MSYRVLANLYCVVMMVMFGMLVNSQFEISDLRERLSNVKPVIKEVVKVKEKVVYKQKDVQVNEQNNISHNNKNLLNIKSLKYDKWKGQIGTDRFGHAIFKDWEYGIRAASFVLKNYSKRHKIDTIESLIHRFCRGNQTEYIEYLSKSIGVKPNEKIELVKYLPKLLKYMAIYESGNHKLPDKLFACYDILAEL